MSSSTSSPSSSSHIRELCKSIHRLKSYRIQADPFSDQDALEFSNHLAFSNCKCHENCDCSYNDNVSEECKTSCRHNSLLRRLEVVWSPHLAPMGIIGLINAVSHTMVSHLHMVDAPLLDDEQNGLRAISYLLSSKSQRLTALALERSLMSPTGGYYCAAWQQFVHSALGQPNSCLKSLDLTQNELTRDHMVELAKALKNDKTLESLTLNGNPIGDDGLEVLCHDALQYNSTIVFLSVGDCNLSRHGLDILSTCLRDGNSTLERVYAYSNEFSEVTTHEGSISTLDYWLDLNRAGRSFLERADERVDAGKPPFRVEVFLPHILANVTRFAASMHNHDHYVDSSNLAQSNATRASQGQRPDLVYGLLREIPDRWIPLSDASFRSR